MLVLADKVYNLSASSRRESLWCTAALGSRGCQRRYFQVLICCFNTQERSTIHICSPCFITNCSDSHLEAAPRKPFQSAWTRLSGNEQAGNYPVSMRKKYQADKLQVWLPRPALTFHYDNTVFVIMLLATHTYQYPRICGFISYCKYTLHLHSQHSHAIALPI